MAAGRIYLDDNATSPLRLGAREAMMSALSLVGNASSVHAEGRRARALIEDAREAVARLAGADPAEVVFTSGAAEANATVMATPWDAVAVSRLEHESILTALAGRRDGLIEIPASREGAAELDGIAERLAGAPGSRRLLVLQLANNETGVVQPVEKAVALAREHGWRVHCDAVQAAGRLPIDFAALGIDTMSLSAHKIGGPKGIGALLVRRGLDLSALIPGGQERRRRGGTENVAAIAGFGAAAVEARAELAEAPARMAILRDRMEQEIRALGEGVAIVGEAGRRLANTSCLALPGQRAETLVIRLDLMGFAVSAGAACSSGKVGASHVLAAMGVPADVARAAIRVSLGRATTAAEVDGFVAAIADIVGRSAGRPGQALPA